jgi:hypothetical protein
MKTFDLRDQEGRLCAFEVHNALLGGRGLLAVVKTIPSVTITRKPLLLFSWFREEDSCEFTIGDRLFVAWEPFGDNSRYWIGPKLPGSCAELQLVRDAFARWRVLVDRFLPQRRRPAITHG